MNKKKIVVAVTGASGAIYASILFEKLQLLNKQIADCSIVFSDNAKGVWKHELKDNAFENIPFRIFANNDFYAPFASGSANYDCLIICPCSMGTMGRIASGVSNDLITRTADVMLKERRKLILVTREMPLNLIHINNMKSVTEAGGIICPASPSFYSHPANLKDILTTVIDKVLSLSGFEISGFQWGAEK
ncbi:MAG: UbiX family flavin prenyltransferase [Bacteroidales bacterium]|jgi:4-hydroxy-3-polyprenylbenzoate decarboxylase